MYCALHAVEGTMRPAAPALLLCSLLACSGRTSTGGAEDAGPDAVVTDGGVAEAHAEAGGGSHLAGTWSCSGELTLTYSSPPQAPLSVSDTRTVTVVDDGDGTLTATTSFPGDAGATCVTRFTASGGSLATIIAGQTCTDDAPATAVTDTYQTGTMTLTGCATATLDLTYGFAGQVSSTGETIAGTGSVEDTCSTPQTTTQCP